MTETNPFEAVFKDINIIQPYENNIWETEFENTELFGKKIIYTPNRVEDFCPDTLWVYEIRKGGVTQNVDGLFTIEDDVKSGFWGTIISDKPINKTSVFLIDIKFSGEKTTLMEYMRNSPENLENAGYYIIRRTRSYNGSTFDIGFRPSTPDCDPYVCWRHNKRGYDLGRYGSEQTAMECLRQRIIEAKTYER